MTSFAIAMSLVIAVPSNAAALEDDAVLSNVVRSFYFAGQAAGAGNPGFNPCLVCFARNGDGVDRAALRRRFSRPIADYLTRLHTWAPSAEGFDVVEQCLDFGVLVDGQDHVIEDFFIHPPTVSSGTARVVATFKNFGEPKRILFDFVRSEEGWRIVDFGPDGFSVRDRVRACEDVLRSRGIVK